MRREQKRRGSNLVLGTRSSEDGVPETPLQEFLVEDVEDWILDVDRFDPVIPA